MDPQLHKPLSPFAERLDTAIERWVPYLPAPLQKAFRQEVRLFGAEHDSVLDTLANIWQRRDHALAFDESTGLARRRPFHDHLVHLLNSVQSPNLRALGVLFIDVDNLKQINDTCGHRIGDKALATVGRIVRESLRVDRNEDMVSGADDEYAVGRHGGDEFLAVLKLTNASEIDIVAPRVKGRADDPERQRARGYTAPLPLTVSVGGVVYDLPASPPLPAANSLAAALVTAADELMYQSKRDGFVHVAVAHFTDKLEVAHEKRISASP